LNHVIVCSSTKASATTLSSQGLRILDVVERAFGQDRLAGGIAVLTGVRTEARFQPPR